jgi:hypothetical protein
MTYSDGLGYAIAGPTASIAARTFAQRVAAPVTMRPIVGTLPVLARPITTTTVAKPVVKSYSPSSKPVTLRPVLPAPTPVKGMPAGKAGVMPVLKLPPSVTEQGGISEMFSFTKSPLLLVGFGLAALALLTRRK